MTVIVQSMKDFAHPGRTEMAAVDLNRAIQSTLTIARSEYKYRRRCRNRLRGHSAGDVPRGRRESSVPQHHRQCGPRDRRRDQGNGGQRSHRDSDTSRWRRFVVRISDSGGGIPEAIRDQVFDPFFTTKDVGKGTGQGLAIARAVIVEKHSGDLSFETEMGHGSTFVIRLPIDVRSRAGVEG